MTLIELIFLGCIAIIIEGFFSGSEMALISADRLVLRKKINEGNHRAQLALKLLTRPEQIFATTLVGSNLCIVFAATLATLYLYNQWGPSYVLYTTLILSPLVLIFGEIIPKTIFQRYAETLAPYAASWVQMTKLLFTPATWALGHYTDWFSKIIQPLEAVITGRHQPSHREELRYLLTYGQKETTLKTSERTMIRRILDFSKAQAQDALTPLVNLDMIQDTSTLLEALELFKKHGYSRFPVYHKRVDNIVGIVHSFDLFIEQNLNKPIAQLMQPAFYAPGSQQLADLLFTIQKRGIHMAVIVDEYGGTVGVVTLEDILEEIVGEIKDEYDEDTFHYRLITDDEFIVSARMEIDAINEQLKLVLPTGDYTTLAGFLLQQFNRIPDEGDELYYKNLKFVIQKATNRAIQMVRVTVLAKQEKE